VLNAIYESDFLGFPYGFRPERSPHRALDALTVGIETRSVNWVLDADIRGFFDTLNHEWLIRFLEHRVADQRVVRLIQRWLRAGVLVDGQRIRSEVWTVQGGSISPLLANIYRHYVFDLWVQRWRRTQARGDVVVVRFANDFVVGFEHRPEAERFLSALRDRFARFGLTLHPDKTLIEFGRYADRNRRSRGDGKPETFNFLGFTHSCGKTRKGGSAVSRQTVRQRWQAKLREVRLVLRRRLHESIPEQGAYLHSVLLGHVRYYGAPRKRAEPDGLSQRTRARLARDASPPQSDCARDVGASRTPHGALASDSPHLPSVPQPALGVAHPKWEPDAVMPHVRICGGGDQRCSFLLRLRRRSTGPRPKISANNVEHLTWRYARRVW
jgi:RNA-directed DNA polymerase